MKVITTFTFCCDNLWKSKFVALEKPPTLWPPIVLSQFYSLGGYTGLGGGLCCPVTYSFIVYHLGLFIIEITLARL